MRSAPSSRRWRRPAPRSPMWCGPITSSPTLAYAEELFPIFGAYFGEIRPASMLIVAGLLKPEMKIEIEVTARLRR